MPALLETLRDLFFPLHCAECAVPIEAGWLCPPCRKDLPWITPPRCETCSQPYEGTMDDFVCVNCRGRAFHFDCAVAPLRSRGALRELVHRFKYGRELWLARPLADFLEKGLADPRLRDRDFDGVVSVPLHARRRREREFNQSEVLGRELSKRRGWPYVDALERLRYTTTQTHFDRQDRMQNLRNAFRLRQNARVSGKNLLLVDDIFTTGSTLDECARTLLEAGAQSICALTVARG
jgi:competence protein ComFC